MSHFESCTTLLILLAVLQGQQVIAAHRNGHSTNSVHSATNSRSSTNLRAAKIDNKFDIKHDQEERRRHEEMKKRQEAEIDDIIDDHKGLLILNRLVMNSFIEPTFMTMNHNPRTGKRRSFSEIPSTLGRVIRGLTNLTVTIGRTINSENVNGSLTRLITSRLSGVSESLMGWVERSVDDLPSIPAFDAQECMKRSICEAHKEPKKYGAVGLVIQLFFPPYLDSENTTKIVSKYQLAAQYGRNEYANCSNQYEGCIVSILDILQSAINMIF